MFFFIPQPQSPTQIVMALDSVEKDDLENDLLKLEEENRSVRCSYDYTRESVLCILFVCLFVSFLI